MEPNSRRGYERGSEKAETAMLNDVCRETAAATAAATLRLRGGAPASSSESATTDSSSPSRRAANGGSAATAPGKHKVLVPERLDEQGVRVLEEAGCEVDCRYDLSAQDFEAALADCEALVVRSGTKVTRELLERVNPPRLRVIGRAGVGVDNIDLAAASERGIVVVNAPTGNCVAAAEHTIAMITSLARNVTAADTAIKAGQWARTKYTGVSLVDKYLGVCGLGRIGREVARRCRGLNMRTLAYDPYCSDAAAKAIGAELVPSLDDLLQRADFITVHMPLTEQTRHMIDAKALNKCKPGVRVVNVARGGIVDEAALLASMEAGHVAGAAIDVFENEPPSKHPGSASAKLASDPRVVATPHLGASTFEAQLDVALEVADAVATALHGDFAHTTVNAPSLPPELVAALRPMSTLAEHLGRLASAFTDKLNTVTITYALRSAEKRNATRFLRASVFRGMLQMSSAVAINYVNADDVAERHGLGWTEVTPSLSLQRSRSGGVPLTPRMQPQQQGQGQGQEEQQQQQDNEDDEGEYLRIDMDGHSVVGRVLGGSPRVTLIDSYEIDIRLDGMVLAYEQMDRPGMIGRVGSVLGNTNVNISFMTLGRDAQRGRALVMLGVDSEPSAATLRAIEEVCGHRPRLMVF